MLNEAALIEGALERVRRQAPGARVIVADGGSTDGTADLAEPLATVVRCRRGRGVQQNAGAAAAGDREALLFLHVDTILPDGFHAAVASALADPSVVGGNFRLRYGSHRGIERAFDLWNRLRRRRGAFYGDGGIFVRREAFERLQGFREWEVLEDLDMSRRMSSEGRTVCLPGPAVTSGRRWEREGFWHTLAVWALIRGAYGLGIPPDRLAGLYRRRRKPAD